MPRAREPRARSGGITTARAGPPQARGAPWGEARNARFGGITTARAGPPQARGAPWGEARNARFGGVTYPPSIAFLRSDWTGLSPSQIRVIAALNASPAIVAFAWPLNAICVAPPA